jgi:hypothetical protein
MGVLLEYIGSEYKECDIPWVDRAARELQGSADRGWTGEGLRVTRQRFPGELRATTGAVGGIYTTKDQLKKRVLSEKLFRCLYICEIIIL